MASWNLGLISISSEVWPHRAGETHTLSLTLPYPDPILCPHHPYPGNGRFGDFRGGQRGPVAEASGHRGHSGGTNISFSAAPCGTQRPAPNALPHCLLYRGEERGGGRTQTMLPFKALPSPQWGGEVCMGQSNTFSQNFTFKRYCLALYHSRTSSAKGTRPFPCDSWVSLEVFWGEQTNAVFIYDVDITKPAMYKAWKI